MHPIPRTTSVPHAIRLAGRPLSTVALAIACGLTGFPPASAQVCVAPAVLIPPDSGPNAGNTLLGDTSIPYTCGGSVSLPAPVFVYRVHFGSFTATAFDVSSGSSDWTPTMYVTDGSEPCGTGQCLAYGYQGSPMAVGDIPPGDHWLLVTASELDGSDAGGDFELAIIGYQPASDLLFRDGFEQDAAGP